MDLGAVVDRLRAAGCVAAEEEAAELLAAEPDGVTLEAWVRRREDGEPLAWIVGSLRFCGLVLSITPGVYVPRSQTEDLADRAAALLPRRGHAVDLCTGIGAVAARLRAAAPAATVVGVDVDLTAAGCARRNGVLTVVGDLGRPIRGDGGFDLVTAVAPYVPSGSIRLLPPDVQRHEPRVALDGGHDGLDLVRRVVADAGRLLRPGGWLVTEVGGEQDRALEPTLARCGFDLVEPWWDEDGDLRGITARRAGPDRKTV